MTDPKRIEWTTTEQPAPVEHRWVLRTYQLNGEEWKGRDATPEDLAAAGYVRVKPLPDGNISVISDEHDHYYAPKSLLTDAQDELADLKRRLEEAEAERDKYLAALEDASPFGAPFNGIVEGRAMYGTVSCHGALKVTETDGVREVEHLTFDEDSQNYEPSCVIGRLVSGEDECAVEEVAELRAELERAKAERDTCKLALRNCAAMLGNGAFVSERASIEFHCQVAGEVGQVVWRLTRERDSALARVAEFERFVSWMRTLNSEAIAAALDEFDKATPPAPQPQPGPSEAAGPWVPKAGDRVRLKEWFARGGIPCTVTEVTGYHVRLDKWPELFTHAEVEPAPMSSPSDGNATGCTGPSEASSLPWASHDGCAETYPSQFITAADSTVVAKSVRPQDASFIVALANKTLPSGSAGSEIGRNTVAVAGSTPASAHPVGGDGGASGVTESAEPAGAMPSGLTLHMAGHVHNLAELHEAANVLYANTNEPHMGRAARRLVDMARPALANKSAPPTGEREEWLPKVGETVRVTGGCRNVGETDTVESVVFGVVNSGVFLREFGFYYFSEVEPAQSPGTERGGAE